MHVALDFDRYARATLDLQVEEVLQVEPKLGISIEIARQAQCRVGSDATALVENLTDAGRRTRSSIASLLMVRPSGFMKSSCRISPG
jgi:hypothetical protein